MILRTQRLAADGGDVLLADAVEARFHVDRDPTLCIGLGGAIFDAYTVAILMPRGSELATTINGWLTERQREGTIEPLVQAHSAAWQTLVNAAP